MQLITEAYRDQNRQLHEVNAAYGTSGAKWREKTRRMSDWGRLPILDYGAGKATLAKSLGPAYRVTNYDPCIHGFDGEPLPHPVVVVGDVMEHVEPDLVDFVLSHIRSLTQQTALFVINCQPSKKTLPDGRNTHICLHPPDWWENKIVGAGFAIREKGGNEVETWLICSPST